VVRRRLARNGIAVGRIKSVEVVERNEATDRVLLLKILHDAGGPHYISGHKFRMAVGPAYDVKSTMFQVESQDGVLRISGLGYGHGVGLPQESARAMAEKGYDHLQILSYFYPGVEFRRFSIGS
jgi:stage II sporulation protein D